MGCETSPTDECGGIGTSVSCVSITDVSPSSDAGDESADIDALRGVCVSADGNTTTPEPFTANRASITFNNEAFPLAEGNPIEDDSFAVTFTSYTITYELINCPDQASGCPALTPFQGFETFTIPPDSEFTGTFEFVPLSVKQEYVAEGGEVSVSATGASFPSYIARYNFNGDTTFFGGDISVSGSTVFTLGNFNLCPQ